MEAFIVGMQDDNRVIMDKFKKYRMLPLRIVCFYLVFTLILYAFGPFAWPTHNPLLFYVLQIFYIVALVLGYKIGIRNGSRCAYVFTERKETKLIKWLGIIIAINCIMIFFSILRDYNLSSFDMQSLFEMMSDGMTNMGSGYNERYERIDTSGEMVIGGSLMTLVSFFWDFFGFNAILLGIIYFKKFNVFVKSLVVLSCLETVVFYVSIGTNIGVFRVVLAVVIVFVVNTLKKNCSPNKCSARKSKKSYRRIWILACVALLGVICFFVSTMKARGGILIWDSSEYNIGGVGIDKNSVIFKILPEDLYIPAVAISAYLTQGYYAFSLCTEVPWTPMFGFGGSLQLVDLISEYVTDINQYTYQYKIEGIFGWDSRVQWASAYTWWGNNVSLYGVVVVMFCLGIFMAWAYTDGVVSNNPFAKVVLVYIALMCIFLPGNNQVSQGTYTLFGFIIAFMAWLVTTRLKIRFR